MFSVKVNYHNNLNSYNPRAGLCSNKGIVCVCECVWIVVIAINGDQLTIPPKPTRAGNTNMYYVHGFI